MNVRVNVLPVRHDHRRQSPTMIVALRSVRKVGPPAGSSECTSVRVGVQNPDFNHNGQVSSQDFFDFIRAFFTDNPEADFNGNQVTNSQDVFDFIARFLKGC